MIAAAGSVLSAVQHVCGLAAESCEAPTGAGEPPGVQAERRFVRAALDARQGAEPR